MFFHDLAGELKPYIGQEDTRAGFIVTLVDVSLREPMTDDELRMEDNDDYNPLIKLSSSMRDQIFLGKRFISRSKAGMICSRYDGADLADEIDNLYDADKDHILSFLKHKGITIERADLGTAIQDILRQIFHGLSLGDHDVDIRLTIYDPQPSIKNLAGDRIYCEGGRLYIDGDTIELPIKLSDAEMHDFETPYISALCNACAEMLSMPEVTVDDIQNLPPKYQRIIRDSRKAYLSAESIQRSIREVYDDGENQFDILKEDVYYGIKYTYEDDYNNGFERLHAVLKQISGVQLTKSRLMLIKNLIGNLERHGIVHILVNDGVIPSWVDPYDE